MKLKDLFNESIIFRKYAFYVIDQEDFQEVKRNLEYIFNENLKYLKNNINKLWSLNKFDLTINFMLFDVSSVYYEDIISHVANIAINRSVYFSYDIFFKKEYVNPIMINELISEFSKVRELFNSFKLPEIKYLDSDHIDVDAYIISYLEFFIKVVEEYEDIFRIAQEKGTEKISLLLQIKKEIFSLIETLQSRNPPQPSEEELESHFREIEDLGFSEEDLSPQEYQDQEERVKEWKDKRRRGEETWE